MIRNTGEIESMASILLLGGIVPLATAIIAQYGLHLPPCHFCMLQRYPYALPILAGIVSLMVPKMSLTWRFCVAIGIFGWVVTAVLGAVHTGIEQGWLAYKGGCVAEAGALGMDGVRAAIFNAPLVSCQDTLASFGGVSMASWNVIFALAMLLLAALQYRHDRRKHG